MDTNPELTKLRERLADQERAYAALLAAVEAAANIPSPADTRPALVAHLDALRDAGGAHASAADAIRRHLEETDRFCEQLRALMAAVVSHLKSISPVMQARDRVAMETAAARCELILRSFGPRE